MRSPAVRPVVLRPRRHAIATAIAAWRERAPARSAFEPEQDGRARELPAEAAREPAAEPARGHAARRARGFAMAHGRGRAVAPAPEFAAERVRESGAAWLVREFGRDVRSPQGVGPAGQDVRSRQEVGPIDQESRRARQFGPIARGARPLRQFALTFAAAR